MTVERVTCIFFCWSISGVHCFGFMGMVRVELMQEHAFGKPKSTFVRIHGAGVG